MTTPTPPMETIWPVPTPTPRTDAIVNEMRGSTMAAKAIRMTDHARQLERDLAAAQEWREAVLNELIVAHIYTKEHDTNPRKAIQDAITWHCQVALDPAVSSDAQKLIAADALDAKDARIKELEYELDTLKEYAGKMGRWIKAHGEKVTGEITAELYYRYFPKDAP